MELLRESEEEMEKKKLVDSIMNPGFKKPMLNEATGKKEGNYSVPIWNLNERNLNGRTYTTALAERIVKENKETLCNDGHDSYTEYAGAMAHAFNPRIENNQLWVDFEFIDETYAAKITFCIDHNIPVGVSSVGYGSMDEHGVVDPDTYELVRYFDFVQHPANETFVAKESKDEEPKDKATADSKDAAACAILRKAFQIHQDYIKSYKEN